MKRLYLLFLFSLTLTSISFGQNKIKPSKPKTAASQLDKFIGTWKLIEFSDFDSATSKWTYRYGKNPKGYFTYTKSGIVNLNISAETPLKISEDSAKNYKINLLNWVYDFALGYFGTYTVDFNKSIVTHHVKGGSLPWYIDTDQPREFTLKGDTLIIGDSKTWKRVLVKAD
jgi:hypothetical protein